MEYVIIGVCIVAAIAVGIVLYLKNNQPREPENTAVVRLVRQTLNCKHLRQRKSLLFKWSSFRQKRYQMKANWLR